MLLQTSVSASVDDVEGSLPRAVARLKKERQKHSLPSETTGAHERMWGGGTIRRRQRGRDERGQGPWAGLCDCPGQRQGRVQCEQRQASPLGPWGSRRSSCCGGVCSCSKTPGSPCFGTNRSWRGQRRVTPALSLRGSWSGAGGRPHDNMVLREDPQAAWGSEHISGRRNPGSDHEEWGWGWG